MRRAAALLSALVILATPLATAGAAGAGTWTHRDARGDVERYSTDSETGERDAADVRTDITRFTVRHLPRKMRLTLKLRDLQRGGETVLTVRIRTPRADYEVGFIRTDDLQAFTLENRRSRAESVPCRGKRIRLDADRDLLVLTVPRTCLGTPRWVRAGAALMRSMGLFELDEDTTMTSDDALRTGSGASFLDSRPLKVGRKVRVG